MHAESKSEEFPLRRPAVFSKTAILSLLISQECFALFDDTDGRMSPHLTKDRFAWIILSYAVLRSLSALDVNNIS